MSEQYAVLSPWADVDPIQVRGISPRLKDFSHQKIGLFLNNKPAADPTARRVEENLRIRFPGLSFSRFVRIPNVSVKDTPDMVRFEEWLKGVDAIIFSVAD
jgi:hypothetical protein